MVLTGQKKGLTSKEKIYSFTINGNNCFAATSDGIFLSKDNGNSWLPKNNGLTNKTVLSLVLKDNICFAGTKGDGVFSSINDGNNWLQKNMELKKVHTKSIASNGENVFVGSYDGIFLTTDNGYHWTQKNDGLPEKTLVKCISINESNIFIGTGDNGVYQSTNNGDSWKESGTNGRINSIIINKEIVIAGGMSGFFLSTDLGESWTSKNYGLPDYWSIEALTICGDYIFAGGLNERGVYFTKDYGTTWNQTSLTNQTIYAFAVRDNYVFACTEAGIILTEDYGNNWSRNYVGLGFTGIPSIVIIGNNILIGAYDYNIYLSTDNGLSWSTKSFGFFDFWPKNVEGFAICGNNIFAAAGGYGVYRAKLSDFGITSVVDSNNNNSLLISPNPSLNIISINLNASQSIIQNENIFIYNIYGKMALSAKMLSNTANLDISSLPVGLYFVRIGDKTGKFVKI